MAAIIENESKWGTQMVGDNGKSCGLVHIHKDYWPEEFANCMDNEFSLRFLAEKIKEGKEYLWTSCSCVSYVRARGVNLPRGDAKDLKPNSMPKVGGVVIFDYGHVAYIEKLDAERVYFAGANVPRCEIRRGSVLLTDPSIKGYWAEGM